MALTVADLPKFGTRQLLKALRFSCASQLQLDRINADRARFGLGPMFGSKESYYQSVLVHPWAFGYDDYVGSEVTVAQLKAELATRPHIPNKHESRKLRQARARAGSPRGRRDR